MNNALPLLLGVHRWSVESWIHLCWTYLCAACRIPLPRTCHKDTEFVDYGDMPGPKAEGLRYAAAGGALVCTMGSAS